MGGKHKQANRTKNNARPSSSSHTAELLGDNIPTFVGFSSIKIGLPTLPGLPTQEVKYAIDSDFQILFKQMNKKDPITRFKALQQLICLVNNSDIDTVNAILPIWSREYCLLCIDVDHKVREVSHKAHMAIVSKVKKMIAPYLKEIAGPWFTSQYDTYAPAASAAMLAFEEAFPSTKLNKAIIFCQKEILSYIYDNLINKTAQSLNNQILSLEDAEAKLERLILASLQGYSFYIQKLSTKQIEEAFESNKKLISSAKFWKFAKNKIPAIRGSFFNVLISLCQNAKFLLVDEASRLSSTIFNNLDESDPVVLQAVWDSALNVLITIEDCWLHINIEKQVFGKLCTILKAGGKNICVIYPNILPLLSQIPAVALKDKKEFFIKMFDTMRYTLYNNISSQSLSEQKIMATTFIECLKFIMQQNISDIDFCSHLVFDQLIPALENVLLEDSVKMFLKIPFLVESSFLVQYWCTHKNEEHSIYEKLSEIFFSKLLILYSKQLETEFTGEGIYNILNSQIHFLNILCSPNRFLIKSKGRVKFEQDDLVQDQEVQDEIKNSSCSDEVLRFSKNLAHLYFKNAVNKEEKEYLWAIGRLINLFERKVIFDEMVTAVNESNYFKLFSSYFSKWLMNEKMKCLALVDLSFKLLKFISDDEKEYILDEFCNKWLCDCIQIYIYSVLPQYSEDEYIMKWAKSDNFSKNLLSFIEHLIDRNEENSLGKASIINLLKTKNTEGEFLIGSDTTDLIINILNKRLEGPDCKPAVIELSQELILTLKPEKICQTLLTALVASLFKLSCCNSDNKKLFKACQTGLRVISDHQSQESNENEIAYKISEVIRELIFSDRIKYSVEQLVFNVKMYTEIILNTSSTDSYSSDLQINNSLKIIKTLLEKDTDCNIYKNGVEMIEKCCRIGYETREELKLEYLEKENYVNFGNCSVSKWENFPIFDSDVVNKCAKWNIYTGNIILLITKALSKRFSTSEDGNVSSTTDKTLDFPFIEMHKEETLDLKTDTKNNVMVKEREYNRESYIHYLINELTDFLLYVALFECFNKYFAGTKYFIEIKDSQGTLKGIAMDIIESFSLLEYEFVCNHLRTVFRDQSLWSLIHPTFIEIFNRRICELEDFESSDKLETYLENLQAVNIAKLPIHRGNYLLITYIIEKEYGHRLTEKQWDGIFIFIHNFFEEFIKDSNHSEHELLTLAVVSNLFLNLINTFKNHYLQPEEKRILTETCLTWNEVVRDEIYYRVVDVWKKLCNDWYNKKDLPPEWNIVLENISEVVLIGLDVKKEEKTNISRQSMREFAHLITSPHVAIQITSFRICQSLIPYLVKLDIELFGNNMSKLFQDGKEVSSANKKSTNEDWSIKIFEKELAGNQGIVEILLSDFVIGDYCAIEPFTDSFTYTYSYLLLWCFVLNVCGEVHSSLRAQYGSWLQTTGFTSKLLDSVFKLMPQTVLYESKACEELQKYFESYSSLDFREPIKSKLIEQIACLVYKLFLQMLPNYVREWWKQTENKASNLVDKITKLYVSPLLISSELKNIQLDKETGFDNIEIETYPGSREIVATYTIDEVKMDLLMTLPPNYPLGIAKIESSNVVVGTTKWRNLLFHISKYLIHQNGTIWDALIIWKNNLDKKFEGVEECYICFSILHGLSFEIPRLCCHTCKKKFHSNCLYKWFSTSNNSTCPICRNLF